MLPAYEKYHYPWYQLYDEDVAGISLTGGFTCLQSVHQFDNQQTAKEGSAFISLNPNTPPPCTTHSAITAVCVFRPCGHFACAACLGMGMINNSKCCVCSCDFLKFVKFENVIPPARMGSWTGHLDTNTGDDDVITLFLDKDMVSGLHGTTSNGVSTALQTFSVELTPNLTNSTRDSF
jgi:hypothetical protein